MGKQRLFFLGACILTTFFIFGIFQEDITKSKYVNPDESVEYFTYSSSLVFLYCAVNYALSAIILKVTGHEEVNTNVYYYFGALLYVLSMVCTNMSLQYVSYPTQVIAKSCKPIPVMILGVLFGKKSYSLKKYVFVFMVVVGVTIFLYKDKKEEKGETEEEEKSGFKIEELLLFASLIMDGLIAAIQEKIKSEQQVKPLVMMEQMNKWATVYLSVFLIVSKEIIYFISFVQRHPSVIFKLIILSVCGFFGQFFIITTVIEFGTLPASLIATCRKFITVLASALLLGNNLQPRQWVGTVILFSGLLLDSYFGKSESKTK